MKYIKILSLAALLIASFFVYRTCRTPTYKNFPPTAAGPWIAFGDSLTSGFGAAEGNDYPTLLSRRLGIPIQNSGVPGNSTPDGLSRLDQILPLQPKVVLLCLGGNDGLQSLPSEQTFANLASIIDQLHQGGTFVVLIGVHSASLRDKNSGRFKKLASEKQVFLIPDILDGVLGSPSLMSDQIHPNEAGYQKIAERLENKLAPLLPQLR